MKTVRLIYNTILRGKWYSAGDPIEAAILPANLQKYIAQPEAKAGTESQERNLMFSLNQSYGVDSEGYLRPSVGRQVAQMEAEVAAEEEIADDLAEAEDSETVASAVESAREDLRAEVEKEKLQASVKARRQEAAEDLIRQEQDEAVASGEFDQWDAEARRDPPAAAASAKGKPKAKGLREEEGTAVPSPQNHLKAKRNSYVCRGGKFLPAASVELLEGENLYWYRKRKFGQTEKFVPFARVEKRKETAK